MNKIDIFKRLYRDYTKKYLDKIFYSGLFSILVAGSTSAIAWLLDPAIEKIFINIDQTTPDKRTTGERKKDFHEIYKEFINEKAQEQSSRCSKCGVPFCQVHCPLNNNISDWLK